MLTEPAVSAGKRPEPVIQYPANFRAIGAL